MSSTPQQVPSSAGLLIGCWSIAVLAIGGIVTLIVFNHKVESQHRGTINNVERVFMHKIGQYSFLLSEGTTLKTFYFPRHDCYPTRYIIKADVPEGKPMHLKWKGDKYYFNSDIYYTEVEIHIHSAKNIEGGAWNRGKFGSGRTVVIR